MGVERGDSAPQLGRTGLKKKVLLLVTTYIQACSIPLSYQRLATPEQSKPFASQGLLKDQLEIVKVKSNGKIRYAIQPLEEQLSFDKVSIRLCYGLAERSKLHAAQDMCSIFTILNSLWPAGGATV